MTHSIDAPFPPPPTPTSGSTDLGSGSGTGSTTDVAKDEARNVGQTATQAGSQVASTAADQAKNVVAETRYQAQDLLQQGRSQLRDQAATQQQKAAQGLGSLAQQLRALADGTSDGAPGPARDLIQQASGKLEEFGSWLQNREPAELLDEVRAYARRKPGAFLLGAALAGVVAGRLTSGIKAAHTGSGSLLSSGSGGSSGNYAVDQGAAYGGYPTTGYAETGYTGTGYGTTGTTTYPEGTGAGYTGTGYPEGTGYGTTGAPGTTGGSGAPLPPPPYGTAPEGSVVPPEGSVVPPTTPAGWDDPARRPGEGV
jgi:hypothetical protein